MKNKFCDYDVEWALLFVVKIVNQANFIVYQPIKVVVNVVVVASHR